MEVTFFRHGIAVDRADPLAPVDFERPLTVEGRNRTIAAARGLRALTLHPVVIWSSPYRRCVQSARLLAQTLGVGKRAIRELDALAPEADPRTLWSELALVGYERVLCVGHGGTIEPQAGYALGLAATASTDRGEDRDTSADEAREDAAALAAHRAHDAVMRTLHLKKGGALHLEVQLQPLSARLAWLLSPRILRQLGRS